MPGDNAQLDGLKSLFGNVNMVQPKKLTPTEMLRKYLYYLPLFILSFILFFGITYIYLRYKSPVYSSSIKILIKDDSKKSSTDLSTQILSQLTGSGKSNIANELELIKSRKLMEKVVRKKGLNVVYYSSGNVKDIELYDTSKNRFISFDRIRDSSSSCNVEIKVENNKVYALVNKQKKEVFNNQTVHTKNFDYTVHVNDPNNYQPDYTYKAVWVPPAQMAAGLSGGVGVEALNKDASIINLTYTSTNAWKARDLLNALATEYSLSNLEDKNRTIDNTIQFIDDRLLLLSGELGGVEENLKDFRSRNNVIDIPAQGQQELDKLSELKSKIDENEIRLQVTDMVSEYVNNPSRKYDLVPSSLGIEDVTLLELVKGYNTDVLKREELLKTLPPGNLAVQGLESELDQLRTKILENIQNIKSTYRSTYQSAKGEYNSVLGGIKSLPTKQKTLLEIERQQGIKEKLYLYLLEKREESAITRASTSSSSSPIDSAVTSEAPIEPKKTTLYTVAFMLGLLIPAGLIYVRDHFNDKITTREDVIQGTKAPLIGEISHSKETTRKIIIDQTRSVLPEQFRIIRTNLPYFLSGKQMSTLLVTSTMPGEGKTFISMNLGAVLSLAGKKVVLLEFDLRRPTIAPSLGFKETQGITNFLTGNIALKDVLQNIDGKENFFLMPSGPVPPNPAELLIHPKMEKLFAELKAMFDYIIIDSPPIGVVSDAKVLAGYSDVNLFILRQRFTPKKFFELVNELYDKQTLQNMAVIVNDVLVSGANGYYGYGNAYGYGYGTTYNYDYSDGYGYGDKGKQNWWKKLIRLS